ncbi:MAG: SET domain-containing protein [Verrucomicrobiales bacterium]
MLFEVRRSAIHGTGVFAARDLERGEHVIQYIGERISKAESERRGLALLEKSKANGGAAVFIFSLNDECDLDGDVPDNDAKLINHSCQPNCEACNISDEIWICALRPIKSGEELTFNYGFDFDTWEDHPCRCGSPNCVGYILAREFWPRLRGRPARRAPGRQTAVERPVSVC